MFWEACKDFEGEAKIWQQSRSRSTDNLVLGFKFYLHNISRSTIPNVTRAREARTVSPRGLGQLTEGKLSLKRLLIFGQFPKLPWPASSPPPPPLLLDTNEVAFFPQHIPICNLQQKKIIPFCPEKPNLKTFGLGSDPPPCLGNVQKKPLI